VPDLATAGEQQYGDDRLSEAADRVGGDHHRVPREAVGPDAADEEEHELGDEARAENESEICG
jgi:hypothetical protein